MKPSIISTTRSTYLDNTDMLISQVSFLIEIFLYVIVELVAMLFQ